MDNEKRLLADLAATEERLTERTRQRDEVQLRLVKSDEQLAFNRAALTESLQHQKQTDNNLFLKSAVLEARDLDLAEKTAHLAAAALELSQRTNQLHESNKYLLNRTAELEKANAELKAMMQQREDFVAALTHDLKNPLVGCIQLLELMANDRIEPEKQSVVLRQMLETNKNMHLMMWNLLDVYRKESGSLTPSKEAVDVAGLLSACIQEFSFAIEQKQLSLHVEAPDHLPKIDTDRVLLRRVLVNLIGNAIKFTPEGGRVEVIASSSEAHLAVAIKDSGPGMSPQHLSRLFERFWQTEDGRKSGIGTGLGLYVSRQIVMLLGGDIKCESTLDAGTTFTVLLQY